MTSKIQSEIETQKRLTRRKTIKVKRGPIQRYPSAIERIYNRELQKIVSKLVSLTRSTVYPQIPAILQDAESTRPVSDSQHMDDYSDQIRDIINATQLGFETEYPDVRLQNIATDIALQTSDFNRVQLQKVFNQMVGVDVFFNEPWLSQEMGAFVNSNVDLIKTVPQRYFNDIEGIMFRGAQQGIRNEEIRSEIISRYGVTRNNARRIARDQIGKFNGQLTQLRQQELGVKDYTWRTVGDERVRGNPSGLYPTASPSHFARDGEKFKWSKPPSDGHPGWPIQCRCWAEPILDDFL